MNYKTQEEALSAWDMEYNTEIIEKAKNDLLNERLEAYILIDGDKLGLTVKLPSKKKISYTFLSAIVRTMAITENTSVENVLEKLNTVLDSDILDPNPHEL